MVVAEVVVMRRTYQCSGKVTSQKKALAKNGWLVVGLSFLALMSMVT